MAVRNATRSRKTPGSRPFPVTSYADITHGYLVALAKAHGLKLATLDDALCRIQWATAIDRTESALQASSSFLYVSNSLFTLNPNCFNLDFGTPTSP